MIIFLCCAFVLFRSVKSAHEGTCNILVDGTNYTVDDTGSVNLTGLTVVPDEAFIYCNRLKEVTFDPDTTIIGERSFRSTSIKIISIPAPCTSIGYSAFSHVDELESVTLMEGLETIGSQAFAYTSISAISIPASCTSIGDSAFSNARKLVNVTLMEGLEVIESNVFEMTSISAISIPSSVTIINGFAFKGVSTLTNLIFNEGLQSIGVGAFSSCISLTSVTIPNSVSTIKEDAFSDCEKLESLSLGLSLEEIELNSFKNTFLKEVTIPTNLTSIGGKSAVPSFDGIVCNYMNFCCCTAGYHGVLKENTSIPQVTCSICTPGSYKEIASNTKCTPCAKGQYMLGYIVASTSSDDCINCLPGTFGYMEGATFCLPCSPGTYQPASESLECYPCPTGKYAESYSSTSCLSCPSGKTTYVQGSVACQIENNQLEGVLSNQGLPVFILIIVAILFGGFGLYLERKKGYLADIDKENLQILPMRKYFVGNASAHHVLSI